MRVRRTCAAIYHDSGYHVNRRTGGIANEPGFIPLSVGVLGTSWGSADGCRRRADRRRGEV